MDREWGACCLFFFFLIWLHHVACHFLVHQPGTEPRPPVVKAQRPNHWTAGEFPVILNRVREDPSEAPCELHLE